MKKEDHMTLEKLIGRNSGTLLMEMGPCNEQRLEHHKKAHTEGEWVREAAKAYAKKQTHNE